MAHGSLAQRQAARQARRVASRAERKRTDPNIAFSGTPGTSVVSGGGLTARAGAGGVVTREVIETEGGPGTVTRERAVSERVSQVAPAGEPTALQPTLTPVGGGADVFRSFVPGRETGQISQARLDVGQIAVTAPPPRERRATVDFSPRLSPRQVEPKLFTAAVSRRERGFDQPGELPFGLQPRFQEVKPERVSGGELLFTAARAGSLQSLLGGGASLESRQQAVSSAVSAFKQTPTEREQREFMTLSSSPTSIRPSEFEALTPGGPGALAAFAVPFSVGVVTAPLALASVAKGLFTDPIGTGVGIVTSPAEAIRTGNVPFFLGQVTGTAGIAKGIGVVTRPITTPVRAAASRGFDAALRSTVRGPELTGFRTAAVSIERATVTGPETQTFSIATGRVVGTGVFGKKISLQVEAGGQAFGRTARVPTSGRLADLFSVTAPRTRGQLVEARIFGAARPTPTKGRAPKVSETLLSRRDVFGFGLRRPGEGLTLARQIGTAFVRRRGERTGFGFRTAEAFGVREPTRGTFDVTGGIVPFGRVSRRARGVPRINPKTLGANLRGALGTEQIISGRVRVVRQDFPAIFQQDPVLSRTLLRGAFFASKPRGVSRGPTAAQRRRQLEVSGPFISPDVARIQSSVSAVFGPTPTRTFPVRPVTQLAKPSTGRQAAILETQVRGQAVSLGERAFQESISRNIADISSRTRTSVRTASSLRVSQRAVSRTDVRTVQAALQVSDQGLADVLGQRGRQRLRVIPDVITGVRPALAQRTRQRTALAQRQLVIPQQILAQRQRSIFDDPVPRTGTIAPFIPGPTAPLPFLPRGEDIMRLQTRVRKGRKERIGFVPSFTAAGLRIRRQPTKIRGFTGFGPRGGIEIRPIPITRVKF